MDVEKRIENIKEYFLGLKIEKYYDEKGNYVPTIFASIVFPPHWEIFPNMLEKFNVDTRKDENIANQFYFWTDFEIGFDAIFDAIEYNIEKNKAAQEKKEIFKEKFEEFKSIFEEDDITISQLKSLTINYRGKAKREKIKKEEEAIKNTENEAIENIEEAEKNNDKIKEEIE